MVRDLVLPNECVFVSILREENVIYPRGNTQILLRDKVVIITNKSVLSALVTELYSGGSKKWSLGKMK